MEMPAKQDASPRQRRRGVVPPVLRLAAVAFVLVAGAMTGAAERAGSEWQQTAWRETAPYATAIDAVAEWLEGQPGGPALAKQWADAVAKSPRPARLGPSLVRIVSIADGQLASIASDPEDAPPKWLNSLGDAEPSLRLAIADQLAGAERYDACLAWTEGLKADEVYSPALLDYLRAVAWRLTIDDERAAELLKRLPGDEADSLGPARDWVVAALARELKVKSEPLPTVARRMKDVQRRLALEEPGKPTQEQQQKILNELDELIKKLEEQRKQQQQMAAASQGGSGADPGRAAEESMPSELKGEGNVDRKRLVAGDAWGSLPPAERERLTQAITRDFPPHYRGLIEDYFRTLAAEADAAEETEASPSTEP
jgi:hypothetical protein